MEKQKKVVTFKSGPEYMKEREALKLSGVMSSDFLKDVKKNSL